MMVIEPVLERAELLLYLLYLFGVVDRRVDLEPVADDPRIGQQPLALLVAIPGDLVDIEMVKSLEKIVFLVEDRRPGQSGLVDLEDEAGKQVVIVLDRKAIFVVVIMHMDVLPVHARDDLAIAAQIFHICSKYT